MGHADARTSRRLSRHLWLAAAIALAALALALELNARPAHAAAAAAGPTCVPASVNASALLDGAVTVSPMPGAADASPLTQISFLGVPAAELRDVAVAGSHSGPHAGKLEAYSQGDGASFLPREPFTPGEQVSVAAQLVQGGAAQPLRFAFTVAAVDVLSRLPAPRKPLPPNSVQHFASRPDLLPPRVSVSVHSTQQAPGDELLAPYGALAQAGPMILDRYGGLLWFEPLAAPQIATNLRVQQLAGAPVLTWWQGIATTHGFGLGLDVIDDTRYRTIAEVRAGNGYEADLHEFQITPAGTALLTAYNAVDCDLAALGGSADSAVTDSLFQEIDIKTGLVMFEWTSLDHVPLSNSYASAAGGSTQQPFDFFHLNSINLDPDGSLLISGRNTWAAYDIDAASGQVLWELGGKQSSFSEGHGAATAYQHDARPDGDGDFTMFDNGATPQVHAQSRGVVLAVNAQTHSVSVLTQFLHPGRPLSVDSQGDLQALPGGDWFVGWGQQPFLSEFSGRGSLLFDASLPAGYQSYRALSFVWNATPTSTPALVLRRRAGGAAAAYASWNGATTVARWELLQGSSADHLARVAVAARSGFETTIALKGDDGYAQVRALAASGNVLGTSAALPLAGAQPGG
jgi:hypothetical protein